MRPLKHCGNKNLLKLALKTLQILKNMTVAFLPNSPYQTSRDKVPYCRGMLPKPIHQANTRFHILKEQYEYQEFGKNIYWMIMKIRYASTKTLDSC